MGRTIEVRNPRTGAFDWRFEAADEAAVVRAAFAKRASQPAWAALGAEGRAASMSRFADALEAGKDEIIRALTIDTGRKAGSVREVEGAIRNVRRWVGLAPGLLEAPVHDSRIVPSVRYQNQYVPYVLCGFISPWNFPVTLSLIDAAPALMAGSAVLIKPSEVTPRFAEPLIRAIAAVPELAAVCGIVLGDGETGAALVDSVDLICFTGSVPTGRKVGEAAARRFIPAFLELGGKDPVIVLEGADIEAAADAVLRGALANSGQACLSIERVYVQRPIFTYFLERLVAKAQTVGLNWPDIDRGHLGPIIFPRQAETLRRHLEDARARGAKIHTGGEIEHHGGLWMGATIVSDVTHDMALMREESFGPVIPVMAFDDVEEAIALANDTEYGLSGAVFASSIEAARLVAERMNAGGVSLNDCALTIVTYEPEKTSFGYSGLGGSRMGPGSIYRFVRKKALIMQSGRPAGLEVIAEAEAAPP